MTNTFHESQNNPVDNNTTLSTSSALNARAKAQHIAFAPMLFQAIMSMKKTGVLSYIFEHQAVTRKDISQMCHLRPYAVDVLVEAGISSEVLEENHGLVQLTTTGYFIHRDELTRVNMNFVHDICYQGMFLLQESLQESKPRGLEHFGTWDSIYQGLSELPPSTLKSWLEFDHYYSDQAMPAAAHILLNHSPHTILDIGGNTGRFASLCLTMDANVNLVVADLPGQIKMLKDNCKTLSEQQRARLNTVEINLLNPEAAIPDVADCIWMSQFLDCFSHEQILSILSRVHDTIKKDQKVYILEPLIDRQSHDAARYSLSMSSLYFTAIANGCSKMFTFDELSSLIIKSGMQIAHIYDSIGISHSLLVCTKKS